MRRIIWALAGVVMLWSPAYADEHEGRETERREIPADLLEVREMLAELMEREGGPRMAEPLDQPVKLEFRLSPDHDTPLSISCATNRFRVNTRRTERGETVLIGIEGFLHQREDGRLGIEFGCQIQVLSIKGEIEFESEGSSVVAIGAKTTLASMGEHSLEVTVKEAK